MSSIPTKGMVSPAPKTKSISMDAWKNSSPSILADVRNRGRKSPAQRLSYDETGVQTGLLPRQKPSGHPQSWLSFNILRTGAAPFTHCNFFYVAGPWVTSPCAWCPRQWRVVLGALGGFWPPKLSRHDHPRSLPLFGPQQCHFCDRPQPVLITAC